MRLLARLANAMLWLVALAWVLLAISWGTLHGLIVPRVDEWRPALEKLAARTVGLPVQIGRISATTSGPVPSLHLQDVVISHADGREALRLPSVRAALSIRSLWRAGFDQLVIEAPSLDIRRTADGRLLLAGIPLDGTDPSGEGRWMEWFLEQTEVAMLNGTLRWTDERRPNAQPLKLTHIDLVVRQRGRQHQVRLDATPPDDWGDPLTLQGSFTRPFWSTSASDWSAWSGQAFGDLPFIDLRQLGHYVDLAMTLGLDLQEGRGGARLWLDIERGQLRQATSDLALQRVRLQWAGASGSFDLQDFQTRLAFHQEDRHTVAQTQGLSFITGEGTPWTGGDIRYTQALTADNGLAAFTLSGEQLDARALRQLVLRLPIPAPVAQWLADTQAEGMAESFDWTWRAPTADQGADWRLRTQLRQVSLAAAPARPPVSQADGSWTHPLSRPGLQGADIDLDITPAGGSARVRLNGGELTFPGVFADPTLRVDLLEAEAQWTVHGDAWVVEVPRLVVKNDDVDAEVRLQWQTADPATSPAQSRFPGVLTLDARIHEAAADQIVRYLPQELPATTRRYLSEALRGGQAHDGTIHVTGDLWDFPFAQPETGRFEVQTGLRNVAFDYAPRYLLPPETLGWPGLQVSQARLTIDRTRLLLENAQAYVSPWPALRIQGARAVIDDFERPDLQVQIQGRVQGPAADALAFIDGSPLRELTDQALGQAQSTGTADLQLELAIPLSDTAQDLSVSGQVQLSGNDLRLTPDTPWLQALQGTLHFNEQGFDMPQATARILGGVARFSGRMQPGPERLVVFEGEGLATAEALAQADYWPWLAPLASFARGQARYQASLAFGPLGTAIDVQSTLQGFSLDLPEPFDKMGPDRLPLRLKLTPLAPGPGEVSRDRWQVELGAGATPLLSLEYLRAWDERSPRVLAGSLGVQSQRLPLPPRGVHAQINLDRFALSAWDQAGHALTRHQAPSPTPAGEPSAYWPTTFGLTIGQLEQGSRVFRNLVASGTRDRDTWKLSVEGDEVSGHLEYREASAQVPGQLYGRLARLDLPAAADVTRVQALPHKPPRALPAINLDVQAFRMGDRDLGRLEIRATNRETRAGTSGPTREWRLHALTLTTPEAQLQASGNWVNQRTALRIALDMRDSGRLLGRFDMPGVIRGGQGQIEGHIGWIGSPLSFHPPSLSGQLAIDVERGQFLRADPGIAKLLGVLSLQSLPRRLALDFRDVFSEGFAFDFVRGHASIRDGIAQTNNLQMKGVSAAVLIEGQADIIRETQDITAVVVPELNAGTASLVATMINPVTGLGTFLAQFLLRQPLQEAATRQFHITGPWADPQVERVTRRNLALESPVSSTQPGASSP
jgi:uncharacterized protein (TIGR02099 family)